MLEEQRHKSILEFLNEQQFASVNELSTQFNVSKATIRRDISNLYKQGRLRKIRGGAEVSASSKKSSSRPPLIGGGPLEETGKQIKIKRLIAKQAVKLCESGELIIVNGGSFTYMMSEFLCARHLSVLTNSFALAQQLSENSDNQITLPGGEIYRKQGIILSAFENDTIQYYQASKMFMSTPGIGKYGVMESDAQMIQAEQKLRKQADQLVLLADSTSLGKRSNFILCPLSEVDLLITDSEADPELVKYFESEGIKVILVNADLAN